MTFGDLLQQMINGLSLGAMYVLLAPDFTPGATHEIGALDQPARGEVVALIHWIRSGFGSPAAAQSVTA